MTTRLERLRPWLLPGVIFAAGAVLRIVSAWRSDIDIDEAWRALIVCGHPGRVRSPILPPLFLSLPRLAVALFGNTEASYRLPGLLFSLGSMALLFALARRIAGRTAAVLALFFLAFQPELIQYDSTFKQFTYEVFFVLALLVLAERVLDRGSLRDRILFAGTAVFGMLFATPLVHVYPAVFIVLAWNEWKRSKGFPLYAAGIGAASLASALAVYFLFMKLPDMTGLNAFWQEGFVSGGPAASALSRLGALTAEMFRQHVYHPWGVLGETLYRPIAAVFLILACAGCVLYVRARKPRFAAYTLTPLVLTAAYSIAGLWPYGPNRVNLFLFPLLMLAAAVGAASLLDRAWKGGRAGRAAAVLLLAVLTVPYLPVRRAEEFLHGRKDLKAAIGLLMRHWRAGDAVMIRDTTAPGYYYYTRFYAPFSRSRKDVDVFNVYHPWGSYLGRREVPVEEIWKAVREPFRSHGRVWLVFKWDFRARQDESAVLLAARAYGKQRWAFERDFVKVLLLEPREDLEALIEHEDAPDAPDIVPPGERVERQEPAEDEPRPKIE